MKRLNPGPFPVEIAFCICPKEWAREMRELGEPFSHEPFPRPHAHTERIWLNDGTQFVVVTFTREILAHTVPERVGLAAHEAVHVWQHIVEHMNELASGEEIEAHTVQWITQWLVEQLQEAGWMRR